MRCRSTRHPPGVCGDTNGEASLLAVRTSGGSVYGPLRWPIFGPQAAGGLTGVQGSDQCRGRLRRPRGDHQKAHDMARNTYKLSFGGCVWGALVLVVGIALVALAFLYGMALLFK